MKSKKTNPELSGWVEWNKTSSITSGWVFIDENKDGPEAITVLDEQHHLKIFSEDVQVLFEGQVVPECCTGGPIPRPETIVGESPFKAIVTEVTR